MSNEYPVIEIVLRKIVSTHIIVRASSDAEAERIVYELGATGQLDDKFTDEAYYDTEHWESYKEGIINEVCILKEEPDEE